MFDSYSTVLKTVFAQLVSNYADHDVTNATELKIYAQLVSILDMLYPDQIRLVTTVISSGAAVAIVEFLTIEGDIISFSTTVNFSSLKATVEAI
jgi:uncharacterized membrane protein